MIEDKINITDFSLKDFPTDRETELHTSIEQRKAQEQKSQHQSDTIQKEIAQEQKKIKEQQSAEKELSTNISIVQKKIENIDEKKIATLKQQKQEILSKQNSVEEQIPKKEIREFIKEKIVENDIQKESAIHILTSYSFIQSTIHQGKK